MEIVAMIENKMHLMTSTKDAIEKKSVPSSSSCGSSSSFDRFESFENDRDLLLGDLLVGGDLPLRMTLAR